MKTPSDFAALTALTHRDFKSKAVITPLRSFELYDDGKQCNVHNWSSEYQAHIYHRLKVRNLNDSLPERSRHNSRQNELCRDLTSALQSKHGCLLNTFMLFSGF